jgi:hypothetical protein
VLDRLILNVESSLYGIPELKESMKKSHDKVDPSGNVKATAYICESLVK